MLQIVFHSTSPLSLCDVSIDSVIDGDRLDKHILVHFIYWTVFNEFKPCFVNFVVGARAHNWCSFGDRFSIVYTLREATSCTS